MLAGADKVEYIKTTGRIHIHKGETVYGKISHFSRLDVEKEKLLLFLDLYIYMRLRVRKFSCNKQVETAVNPEE